MKLHSFIIVFFFILLVIPSCDTDIEGYTTIRRYYANSFVTRLGADLRTAGLIDSTIKSDAYYARIKGTLTHINDTVVQHGHCWSTTNSNPYIVPGDTGRYSRFGPVETGTNYQFETRITNLLPETPFWVRTYVVTAKGDTGYNKVVWVDTTRPPIDTWFKILNFLTNDPSSGSGREGTIALSMKAKHNESGKVVEKNCGYVGLGNNAGLYYNDFIEFDPSLGTDGLWNALKPFPGEPRHGAVAFTLTYTINKNKFTKAYVGLGVNSTGVGLTDFYEYDRLSDTWIKKADFPSFARKNAVAFTFAGKGVVGLGENKVVYNDFYMFDPVTNTWTPLPSFPVGRRTGAISFSIDGKGFVGLGKDNNGVYYNDLWMYVPGDFVTDFGFWSKRTSMPVEAGNRAYAVGFAIEDQGYVGTGFNGISNLSDFYRYDPYNNLWYNVKEYKNGTEEVDPKDASIFLKPQVRKGIGFSIDDKGYVGTGYIGEEGLTKYSPFFWVYRP